MNYFCRWCKETFSSHSFTCSCPVFQAPIIDKAVFSPLYIASFIIDYLTINVWAYSSALCSVPLIHVCFCASTMLFWWLSLCSIMWRLGGDTSSFVLFPQGCFDFCGSIGILKLSVLVLQKNKHHGSTDKDCIGSVDCFRE